MYNVNPAAALYVLLFMIIVGFFALNLLIGVVVQNFSREKDILLGYGLYTEAQRQWLGS